MLLRYLAHIKHPVQDAGRPIHKPPDLQKVQLIVDHIKNVDFLKSDEETTCAPEVVDSDPTIESSVDRRSRNVYHDLTSKVKKFFSKSKKVRSSRSLNKRKSMGLFDDIKVRPPEQSYKSNEKSQQEISDQEAQVLQQSEESKLQTDLNKFQSKLSAEQQLEISNFLDHVDDKPQPFKFDTTPYMLTQLEKQKHPTQEQQQEAQVTDDLPLGARRFFDFDNAPVKRSLDGYQAEDYQKIAKLKSKLIDEYRHHHPLIDYSDILRRMEAGRSLKVEKPDDFLDQTYQLNDGSSRLKDVLKPYQSDFHVLSPYELNLNFQLDKQFKELDSHDQREPQTEAVDSVIPLYKPGVDNERVEELLT